MPVKFDFLSVVTALGMAQGLFLSIILWVHRRGHRGANRILSVTILLISISIAHGVLTYTNLYYRLPHLLLMGAPIAYLLGPLLLIYLNYLTRPGYRLSVKEYLMFLPALICIAVLLPFFMKSGPEKLEILSLFLQEKKLYLPSQIMNTLSIPHMIIYLVIIWRRISQHENRIKQSNSNIESIDLSWVKFFVLLYSVSFLLMIVIVYLRLSGNTDLQFERSVPLVVAVSIYYFGYRGFQQAPINLESAQSAARKYERSPLSEHDRILYKEALLQLVNTGKVYRDPDLTLVDLAHELEINRNLLSQLINEEFNCNFYTFINTYRVNEIVESIQNHENSDLSLLHIAMNAGFNSKSTFNAVFKKITGVTPSAYRRQLKA